MKQRVDQTNLFDKSVLALSGGALGLSITFVDKFGGVGAGFGLLLFSSWMAFGAAIVLNVTSYITAFHDADYEIEKIDDCLRSGSDYTDTWNPFKRVTGSLNIASLVMFAVGVILLAAHAATANGVTNDGSEAAIPQHREEGRVEYATRTTQPGTWSERHWQWGLERAAPAATAGTPEQEVTA